MNTEYSKLQIGQFSVKRWCVFSSVTLNKALLCLCSALTIDGKRKTNNSSPEVIFLTFPIIELDIFNFPFNIQVTICIIYCSKNVIDLSFKLPLIIALYYSC